MKSRQFVGLDVTLYKETLDNGLSIYLIPQLDKKKYFMTYATKYGSDDIEFVPVGKKKMIKYPTGIAHFLEHKMFEQEDGIDPFTFFSKSGTDANAATDHNYTKYICSGTKNFTNNLEYLLDYVNAPYFTDINVEKEKGIIEEELNMYLDIPEYVLEDKFQENIFHVHPRRIDVGGTVDDIKTITKEQLYECYNTFYCPSNMFILLVGNFDKDEALKIIKNKFKDDHTTNKIKLKDYDEPYEVRVKEETIDLNIKVPRVLYANKYLKKDFPLKSKEELLLYLNMILQITFGSSSKFKEQALKSSLMTTMYYGLNADVNNYIVFEFYAESKKQEELVKLINKTINNMEISEEEFNRCKKVWVANEVRLFDYAGSVNSNAFSDIIMYDDIIVNRKEKIKNMNMATLKKVIDKFKTDNNTILYANIKEEK